MILFKILQTNIMKVRNTTNTACFTPYNKIDFIHDTVQKRELYLHWEAVSCDDLLL